MSVSSLAASAAARLSWRNLRELAWVMAGQGAALVSSIVLTKVIASKLGADEYGRYTLGLTAAVLLNQFLMGPVSTSALRFFAMYRDEGRLPAFLAALRRIVGTIGGGAVLLTIPGALFVAHHFGRSWALLFVFGVAFGFVQNVFALLNGLDIAARHRFRAALQQAADPAARVVAVAALFSAFGPSAVVGMLGVTVGMALVAVSQTLALGRSFRRVLGAPVPAADITAATGTLVRFAQYFVVGGVFTWLQLSSDRWALKIYLDNTAVGLYAVAYQIASVPAVILAGCLSQFISPIVFQRAQDGRSTTAIAAARRAILVGAGALIGLTIVSSAMAFAFGERIVILFTSPVYRASGAYIAPLVVGLGLLQVGHILSLLPMSSNRLGGHLIIKIAHGIIAMGLNALSVRTYGVPGLCAAAVLGGAIYVLLVLGNNHRIMKLLAPDAPPLPPPLLQP